MSPSVFVKAVKGLLGKSSKKRLRGEQLREWIHARPELVEGARQGFDDIRAGRYRRVSRRREQT